MALGKRVAPALGVPGQAEGRATLQSDRGDETQARFMYQWAAGVITLAGALTSLNKYVAIWCEHHDDLMAELQTGHFHALQVKTVSSPGYTWTCRKAGFVDAVRKFAEHESNYPSQIERYIFFSNAKPYIPANNNKTLQKLASSPVRVRDECRSAAVEGSIPAPYKDSFDSLVKTTGALPATVFEVLKKLEFQQGPPLEGFREDLVRIISGIPDCKLFPPLSLDGVRDSLLQLVGKASSLDVSALQFYASILQPDGRPEALVLGKRISVTDFKNVLNQNPSGGFRHAEVGGFGVDERQRAAAESIPGPTDGRIGLTACERRLVTPLDRGAPFDLGALWGLRRAPFIGIVANTTELMVEHVLLCAERTLFDGQFEIAHRLPDRFWVSIDHARCPNGPTSAADVWRVNEAVDTRTPQSLYLAQSAWDKSVRAGFVLQANNVDEGTLQTLMQWCRELMRLFPGKTAVVLDLRAPRRRDLLAGLRKISTELAELFGSLMPVEAVMTHDVSIVGVNVMDWASHGGLSQSELGVQYPAMTELVANVTRGAAQFGSPPTLDQVIDAFGESELACAQLFDFIRYRLPEDLPGVVCASAASRQVSVRRAALAAAKDDALMDAFLQGWNWDSFDVADDTLLPDGNWAPANDFFLALLRRFVREPRIDVLQSTILQMREWVSPHLFHLSEVALGLGTQPLRMPQRAAPADWLAVTGAGLDRHVDVDDVMTRLDEVGPWWWLLAQPPSRDTLARMIKADLRHRAVLGLVDDVDIKKICKDNSLVEFIRERRRGRLLKQLHPGGD